MQIDTGIVISRFNLFIAGKAICLLINLLNILKYIHALDLRSIR